MTAIITDVKYRMAISLIRDLADNGIDVVACHSGEGTPFAFYSKGISRSVILPDCQANPELFLDELSALCKECSTDGFLPALLPVGAKTLSLLSSEMGSKALNGICGICIPSEASLDLANDKTRLALAASEYGVPVPKSYDPKELGFESLPYPLVIKPVCGEKQGLSAEQRYVIAHNAEEAKRSWEQFSFDSPAVIQDYIDGDGYGFSVLADKGKIINSICHKRIREYPLSGGPSTCCMTYSRDFLLPYAESIVKLLNFTGLGMIEFKLDSKGNPYLLEMNPRVWGTFPLTRVAESSFAYDWYALSAKLPTKNIKPKDDIKMYYLLSDMRRAAAALISGKAFEAFSSLKDWLSPTVKEGIFEFSDLRASIKYLVSYINRGIG
ncbi:MAG: ATP-grasp domain-containing protein [Clostridiaceae bacterium]|nr:ATP-grasp domain-containing protein [Clostridiaceae bacterium]